MVTLPILCLALGLGASPAQRVVKLSRLPRVAGKADLTLWRSVLSDRLIYSRAGRPVFVRARDARGLRALRSLGVDVASDQWSFAQLDASALLSALQSAGDIEVRSAPAHRPLVSRSTQETGVTQVHTGYGVQIPRRGHGVLIGIVDTGLEWTHPAFFRPDGSSRVVAIWDQDAADGVPPRGFGYGAECTERVIARGRCEIVDEDGHGTHVSGIAAGSGPVPGVASAADIAVVQSDAFTRLADAVAYLTDLAAARAQPIVINISVGGHYGPHDGRTPLEKYLGALVGRGRLIVAAAGNDGSDRTHVGAQLSDRPVRVEIVGMPPSGFAVETIVELWSEPTANVALWLELWLHDKVAVSVPLDAPDSDFLYGDLIHDDTTYCSVSYGVDYVAEHRLARRTIVLDREKAQEFPANARLALRMSGSGMLNGWVSQSDYTRGGSSRFGARHGPGWIAGDGRSSITVPATSPRIIAVGSYTVRTSWESQYDGERNLAGLGEGMLAPYSSLGPSGRPGNTGYKPDLTAPGTVIISARAASVHRSSNTVDAQRVVMQGTSMAAPHVAGVVALMLEANPEIGPDRARQILCSTARADAHTGPVPNNAWGHGKIDAAAAVAEAESQASGCAATRRDQPWLAGVWATLLVLGRRRRRCIRAS